MKALHLEFIGSWKNESMTEKINYARIVRFDDGLCFKFVCRYEMAKRFADHWANKNNLEDKGGLYAGQLKIAKG